MKIISLNTYSGTIFEPLMNFVEEQAPTTDVFCFQEIMSSETSTVLQTERGMRKNLLQELSNRLTGFQRFFAPVQENFDLTPLPREVVYWGIATYVKNTLPLSQTGDFFLCNGYNTYQPKSYATLGFNALYTTIAVADKQVTLCNIHGISEPGNKLDSPERLKQSEKILTFLQKQPGEKIVLGDFNLFPETQSIKIFEQAGLRNLIKECGIQTTRGSLMRQIFPQYGKPPNGFQEFADYTFVSPGIKVKSFEVPDLPISDHLPMILEIDP